MPARAPLLLPLLPAAAAAAPPAFPLYKQCDAAWGGDQMGVEGPGERDTVCHQGCAMSCVAMALAGYGYTLPGASAPPTPGTLNAWLVENAGYRCLSQNCNNLVLDAPDVLTAGRMRLVGEWGGRCCGGDAARPPLATLQAQLAAASDHHLAFIAHVRHNSHFVLLTSWDPDAGAFRVNDPGFNATHYNFTDISDVLMYSVLPPTAVVPKQYPLFKQYDYQWANDTMVTTTVSAVGCLMSSTSMALNAHGVTIPTTDGAAASDPGTLNAWLRTHNGYVGDNNMNEAAVPAVAPGVVGWSNVGGMHRTNDVPLAAVRAALRAGQPVIANVMHGGHFVLVVGTAASPTGTELFVNDPGFYRNSYDYAADVVGWRLFNMSQAGPATDDFRGQLMRSRRVLRPAAEGI